MQRDNSDTAQAVSFCLTVGHLYQTIGMDRYQPSSGVITGPSSGVNIGLAKRDNAAVLMSVKRGVNAVFVVWL